MNGDEEIDLGKELGSPTAEGVLKSWSRLIKDLRASEVCYCAGKNRGREPEFENFIGAIPLLGTCNALVYAEPSRSKGQVAETVRGCGQNLPIPIQGGHVTGLSWLNNIPIENAPDLDRQGLFVVPVTPWLPPEEQPADDRFWGEYAKVWIKMEPGRRPRRIHLLHIGIGGVAGALYFFQPHRIEVSKIIGNPF